MSKPVRAIIDANILISYLLARDIHAIVVQIVRAAALGDYRLLIIPQLLTEIVTAVAVKPYLRDRIRADEIHQLITLLGAIAESVPPITEPIPAVTRDPKDDYLLAHAVVTQADYLVTGDRDLLVLDRAGQLRICAPADFLSMLNV